MNRLRNIKGGKTMSDINVSFWDDVAFWDTSHSKRNNFFLLLLELQLTFIILMDTYTYTHTLYLFKWWKLKTQYLGYLKDVSSEKFKCLRYFLGILGKINHVIKCFIL